MLSRTITIADLIGEIKRESSKWIKSKGGLFSKFPEGETYTSRGYHPREKMENPKSMLPR
jgi:hypothetical protein